MLSTRNSQVALKIEGVEGVKETLAAADFILASSPKFTPGIKMYERADKAVAGDMSPVANIPGLRDGKISFEVELCGAAAAGTAPHYSAALRCCGVGETIVALTSVAYKPISVNIPSCTVAIYEDGKIKRIWGARGTCTIKYNNGEPAVASFTFTGADWEVVDGDLLTGVTYPAVVPPTFQEVTFSIGGYEANINAMEIDLGNTVALRKGVSAASGHISARITGRKPTLKIDPEDVLVAAHDFFGTWRAGTPVALSASMGSTAGNTIATTAPKAQYQSVSAAEREKLATLDINALLSRNLGNDEWQILIT
ncbi:MAG: phage tail tube protein [Thermodesulfobacteriota bacterium]